MNKGGMDGRKHGGGRLKRREEWMKGERGMERKVDEWLDG
jgi:hypothetical protein